MVEDTRAEDEEMKVKGKEVQDADSAGSSGSKKKGKEKEPPPPMVPFFSMFRYATKLDVFFMVVGSIGAALNGANIGIAAWVLSYFETGFWMLSGERQIRRVRENYLQAVLRQEIGWFDVSKPSEISTRISSDTAVMQEGIDVGTFVGGFVVGFVQGWQLTLVILAVSPLLGVAGGFMAVTLSSMTKKGLDAYAGAGAVAEECISNIRTVTTFNAYKKESDRYTAKLKDALIVGIKKGFVTGGGMGSIMFVMFCTYALAFWYGSKLISDKTTNSTTGDPWTGGDVVSTFFAVVMGAFAIGQAGPSMQAMSSGRAAAFKIFTVIDRESKIDPFDTKGQQPAELVGNIEFKDAHFTYPSRTEVPILRGLNLSIKSGQTVALVGESGCGKSTTVALLEKFYLAEEGGVYVDGIDVKDLNTRWLRKNFGLVSQEPQLFATSIAENIRFGKEAATLEEIIEASKAANAHDFISKLPSGYDTQVGEKGVQMSGGQKQRIAIARAIVKDPKVLLLDEATSALDTENERLVQEALDRMMVGRTTIVIAHRLATVKNADKIVVIKEGKVAEEGTHSELIAANGLYYHLVHKQTKAKEDDDAKMMEGAQPVDVTVSKKESVEVFKGSDPMAPLVVQSSSEKGAVPVDEDKPYPFSYSRLARESRPEIWIVVGGILAACLNGSIMPIFAIVYSEIVATFNKPDPKDVRDGANFLAAMFVVLAVGAGVGNFFQISAFSAVGEKLTFRLRDSSFRSILRQSVGWFDLEKNATGVLTTKLATDATLVQGVTTQRVSLIFQNTATVVAGLVIAFVAGWKLSLVILACMPLVVFSSSFQMKFMKGFSQDSQKAYEKAGVVATEAVGQIRTVASFTNEEKLMNMYSQKLDEPCKLGMKKAHVAGIGFGASQFAMFAINCLGFWYGGKLVDEREWSVSASYILSECTKPTVTLPFDQCENQVYGLEGFASMMRVFFAIIMMGMGLGQSSSFAPDAAKASAAASSIYELIDRKSSIDPDMEGGEIKQKVEGTIEFRDVFFTYPSRPNMPIFQGFNLSVPAGKKLALVGDSGGGKSTVISLLERFYDPIQGSIYLDGTEIKSLDIKYLRSQISLVSQEPSLFSTTIAKNIAYGKDDATMDEIIEAAQMANCHNFITELPNGYNTLLGDKYTQLSGGQKQRVAIARALLRNPKVMLLDEATSALDSESERLVQEALERVMKGRTTIVIAHRLSTIMDSDVIAVMKGGRIVELGNHQDLLAHGGVYTNLIKRQL